MSLAFAIAADPLIGSTLPVPATISGLILWCRSDKLTLSGSNVLTWTDQSGQSNDLTQVGSNALPTYTATDASYGGAPSVSFTNGSTTVLGTAGNLAYSAHTIIVAAKAASGTVYLFVHEQDSPPGEYVYAQTNDSWFISDGSATDGVNVSAGWIISSSPQVLTVRFDGNHANDIIRLDGVAQSITHASTGDPSTVTGRFFLGGTVSGGGGLTGTVAEICVYNRALTLSEYSSVETYMRTRYGI